MTGLSDFLKKAISDIDTSIRGDDELRKDRKVSDLADRVGSRNLEVLLNLPKTEKKDILKRLKKMKEIR